MQLRFFYYRSLSLRILLVSNDRGDGRGARTKSDVELEELALAELHPAPLVGLSFSTHTLPDADTRGENKGARVT